MSGLKRIVAHWTVGTYKSNPIDRAHYHFIIEGDGNIVAGGHKPEANIRPVRGRYAAHCLNLNTGSIGISMASMAGAQSERDLGPYPFTEVQFDSMCRKIADLCRIYDIVPSRMTVLSHAEVQPTLGIKQRGKWDFTVIPFMPHIRGAIPCGDEMRRRVRNFLGEHSFKEQPAPAPKITDSDRERIRWLQRLLAAKGFDPGIPDGLIGKNTRQAIGQFQYKNNLPVTEKFDTATVAKLRAQS